MPLPLPDGTDSGEWLHVLGVDARAYVQAQQVLLRRFAELGRAVDAEQKEAIAEEIVLEERAALITAWSFDEPFTKEAAIEFMRQAPRISKLVLDTAKNAVLFTGPGSMSSTPGLASSNASEAPAGKSPKDASASDSPSVPPSSDTSSTSIDESAAAPARKSRPGASKADAS